VSNRAAVMSASVRELTFAPEAVRGAYSAAASGLVDVAGKIPAGMWHQPGLGVWTVRDLVGHAGRSLTTVPTYLATGTRREIELHHAFDYFAVYAPTFGDPAAVAERGRQAGAELGADPVGRLAVLRDEALSAATTADDDAPVLTAAGVMRLIDYLPSRIFELVVHTGDIIAATGVAGPMDKGAAVIATVFAAAVAAERADFLDLALSMTGRRSLPDGYSIV
jgi:hypothetical protein